MRLDGAVQERPFDAEFDYVVVGSGAGGAAAARTLADTGRSVAVVEEGPDPAAAPFAKLALPGLARLLRGLGGQVARGRAFAPVLQGRCLGGTTVVNSAIVRRLPEDVWREWRDAGLEPAVGFKALEERYGRLERELSAAPTPPDAWGEPDRLMRQGAAKLGVAAAPTTRFVSGCKASARCLTGCPNGAKQSLDRTFLPYAEARGAALLTGARVDRVDLSGTRATGVSGRFMKEGGLGPAFALRARRAVLVAASVVQTPLLLRASGVRSPHLGAHFKSHPGVPLTGLFDRPVGMWTGATQGYDSDHHRRDGRFKVETISLPAEIVLSRMPGAGRRWLDGMAETPHAAVFAVQLRARAEGTVRPGFFGLADVRYGLAPEDFPVLRKALRYAAELLFAAGAREILTGIHGLPERLGPDRIALLDAAPDDPACYAMILSHLFGTARLAPTAADGVVGLDFRVHGADNLYVADASLFPSNIGVNPQLTIMALAQLAAERAGEARP